MVINIRQYEVNRIRALSGDQVRGLMLYILNKGYLDNMKWQDLKLAIDIAENLKRG